MQKQFSILQINSARDTNRSKFFGSESDFGPLQKALLKGRRVFVAHLSIYDEVYKGKVAAPAKVEKLLARLFEQFNIDQPDDFIGHYLSVSDIVQIGDRYYFCDSYGWIEVAVVGEPSLYDSDECRRERLHMVSGILERVRSAASYDGNARRLLGRYEPLEKELKAQLEIQL